MQKRSLPIRKTHFWFFFLAVNDMHFFNGVCSKLFFCIYVQYETGTGIKLDILTIVFEIPNLRSVETAKSRAVLPRLARNRIGENERAAFSNSFHCYCVFMWSQRNRENAAATVLRRRNSEWRTGQMRVTRVERTERKLRFERVPFLGIFVRAFRAGAGLLRDARLANNRDTLWHNIIVCESRFSAVVARTFRTFSKQQL